MPLKFQRPENLPEEIPIYHTTTRDFNADLILKITAMATNKTAVFPVFKEEMVEYLPTYFGMIFDKEKDYEFKENRLQAGEYFEIKIPNLKDPESVALFMKEFFYSDLKISGNQTAREDWQRWLEFYWIANYFCEEKFIEETTRKLALFNEKGCLEIVIDNGVTENFLKSYNDIRKKNYNQFYPSNKPLIQKLLKPGTKLDLVKIQNLQQLGYKMRLGVITDDAAIPIDMDERGIMTVPKDKRNIYNYECQCKFTV